MSQNLISALLYATPENHYTDTLHSLAAQAAENIEIVLIHHPDFTPDAAAIEAILKGRFPVKTVATESERKSVQLNAGFKACNGSFIMLADNPSSKIEFKIGAAELFLLAVSRESDSSMVYCDYERITDGETREIRLLKHHTGRVRDNQDFGPVWFLAHSALKKAGYADENLAYKPLYDLRLKMARQGRLIHIANRYAGSLYSVTAEGKGHNVFDYLMAGKESQLEAEEILSSHLKGINAYLAPGAHYAPREIKEGALKASVIIPVNNRPVFIGQAIESVQAQTVKEVEVIVVVNGGPGDPTVDAVKAYMEGGSKYDAAKPDVRLLVYEINNLGLCLNMGARIARGTYYVQLDSDDRLKPDAVEKILEVYASDPKIGMVIGSYEVWQKEEDGSIRRMEELPVVTHDEWTEENGRNNLLRINGAGAPRSIPIELIRRIGFSVNEEPYARNYGEDYGMVLKISEQHRIGRVWDAIYEVIRHSGGTDHSIDQATIDRNDEAKDFMRLEAILRRQELNAGQ